MALGPSLTLRALLKPDTNSGLVRMRTASETPARLLSSQSAGAYDFTERIRQICSTIFMCPSSDIFLWAVHISDGVLADRWWLGGFAAAGLLALAAAWRIREEEVPKIALLTAAFFVASLLHVRVGPTSVHLLLNGLVGVVLGWRAGLAILVGLALQVALLGHGGRPQRAVRPPSTSRTCPTTKRDSGEAR